AAATTAAAAFGPTKQASQALLQFLKGFIKIRRTLIIATPRVAWLITATRFIPGHALSPQTGSAAF
ncbi:MAG: hypothetical protein ACI9KD_002517, partial [Congregibacter sp.]